jgi:hypothetical protein
MSHYVEFGPGLQAEAPAYPPMVESFHEAATSGLAPSYISS